MASLRHDETEIPLTAKMRNKVRKYAHECGGIYRMNTHGAEYYDFTPFKDATGAEDFCGGFGWRVSYPNNSAYVYSIKNNVFIEMDKVQTLKDTGKF